MKYIALLMPVLLLSACVRYNGGAPVENAPIEPVATVDLPKGTQRVATNVRDDVRSTADRLKDWMLSKPEQTKQAVPAAYCYRSLQDVLCYRQPMPGWEARLVGYQGTDAPAPNAAMMQPLPVRANNAAMLPANRAANAKPLVPPSANVAKVEDKALEGEVVKSITVDAAHESLPDPALAPQL